MIKILREVTYQDLEKFIYNIDVKDPNLYIELQNSNKIGLFQINGKTAERLCDEVAPENFDELIAINAMARPGPMEAAAPYYVERKHGSPSPYPKAVNDIIKDTHNTFVYQEQIMEIFHKIGGFTLEEANEVRGLMKKLGKLEKNPEDVKKWEKTVKRFIHGATRNGIDDKTAEKIAEDLASFSGYSFNKCISGKCKIDRDNKARWSPTIEEMFLCKNNKSWAIENNHESLHKKYNTFGYGKAFSLKEDNKLYPNNIIDITFAGKRIVFEVVLEDGKKIKVTKNHKFPTNKGVLSLDTGLSIGDMLFVNEGFDKNFDCAKYNFTNTKQKDRIFKSYEGEGFKNDEKNSGYIDGESLKFKECRKLLLEESNGICKKCLVENKKLECHHKDGNRKNNEIDNLMIVCLSCHKKLEYELGRVVKNTKGKITSLKRIVEINEKDEENTYNIEMDDPFHDLSVNNISVLNSHATSYSYIAAITVYLSFYFRPYYYSSVLTYEMDREAYLFERLCAVKEQGIKIYPPEINTSHEHFYPNGDYEIRFGLGDIKYVSDNPTKEIIENRPYTSLYDFIVKTRSRAVTSRVISALISVGAFDRIELNGRVKLLTIFNSFWEQKKQTKIAEKLKQLWDDCSKVADSLPGLETTKEKMIEFEKEFFGFKFFTSPFTDDRVEIIKKLEEKKLVYYKLADVREASRKTPICLNAIRSFKDKNGNEMAFIEVEDLGGSRMSIPIFQSFYKYVKDQLVVNELYLMNLYLDNKDKVLFGRSGWTDDEYTVKRMVKKI